MGDRFSILSPMPMQLQERILLNIIKFFGIGNATKRSERGAMLPNSVNEFFSYLKENGLPDAERYNQQIKTIMKKLENSDFLSYAGSDGYSLGGEKCFYFSKELSKIQMKNNMWFGEYLGLEYIYYKGSKFVVPITGINNNDDVSIGSGTLVNSNTILTCAHVVRDMRVDENIVINDKKIKIDKIKFSDKVDIGFIILSEEINMGYDICFGDTYILDEIITMGYPPIPFSVNAYLVAQRGEINSVVHNYDNNDYIIYSSITRPGNSGGPIFNKRGHMVGISIQQIESENAYGKNIIPFYQGIPTHVILKIINELDPDIRYCYEDYQ